MGGFTDVPTDHTSAIDIERAKTEEWFEGHTREQCVEYGLEFPCLRPDASITVEQMARALDRAFTKNGTVSMTRGRFTTFMVGGFDRLYPNVIQPTTTTTTTPTPRTTTTPPTVPAPPPYHRLLGSVSNSGAYVNTSPPCSSWTSSRQRQIVVLEQRLFGDFYELDGYQFGECAGSSKSVLWNIKGHAVLSYIPYPDAERQTVRIPFGGNIRLGQDSSYFDDNKRKFVEQREVDARWAASTIQLESHSWGSVNVAALRVLCREYENLSIWRYNRAC